MSCLFPLLIISGPTAAGKTDLSIRLAKHYNAEILNIDSVQMYYDCNIGSAKPSVEVRCGVTHHLFDICSPNHKNNAAFFLTKAQEAIRDIRSRGKNVIACGGTMLYLKALLYDLAELPKADQKLREKKELLSSDVLYQELSIIDPEMAQRLHQNDRTRIIRALEIFYLTGEKASSLQQKHAFQEPKENAFILIPTYSRDVLYQRINERTKLMLNQGIIEETKNIIDKYGENAAVLDTVGYKEVKLFLKRTIKTQEDLFLAISQSTRQLAKRQMVFWRNEPLKRNWEIINKKQLELLESRAAQSKKSMQKDFIGPKLSFDEITSLINNINCKHSSQKSIKICYFS